MPWKQITSTSKAAYEAGVSALRAAGKSYIPVTFNVTLSEIKDGNAFLKARGEPAICEERMEMD